ncbi:MAG TPA: GIY-YIG nuclease family protein [Hyphomonadaceae bacterium]|nr:GIY-YIG nuclease family protein [Hyphomonadaceae bacterium]
MRYWVYILECSDGKYYVGSYRGDDPAIRVSEHNSGRYLDAWTARRLPAKLVWSSEFQRIADAIAFEQRIKRWRRAKKEAVIRGEWNALPELARAYSRRLPEQTDGL